jgi:uncharacterized protein YjbI with pentapeptide repeats
MSAGKQRWIITLGMSVAALAVVILVMFVVPLLFAPPRQAAAVDADHERGLKLVDERLKLQNDVRNTALQAVGGVLLVLGAVATWRQVRIASGQLDVNRRELTQTLEATHAGQITQQFAQAIAHLGVDSAAVQVGGVYTLERIAKDSEPDRHAINEILSAYVREHAKVDGNVAPGPVDQLARLEVRSPGISAAMAVLGGEVLASSRGEALQLGEVDLRNANFDQANFAVANFEGADLEGTTFLQSTLNKTNFRGANLRGTEFRSRASLRNACLENANLEGAELKGSDLHKAVLIEANLRKASLDNARLDGAFLDGADLEDSQLLTADLTNASLFRANLQGADLSSAKLQGAKLTSTRLERANLAGADLERALLRGATANSETTWPTGFDPEAAGVTIEQG